MATTTGRGIGVLVQLYALSRQRGRVTLRREHLRLDPGGMLGMVRLSGSAVVQGLIPNLGWLGLVRILATFGSDALAGFGPSGVFWSIAVAYSTMAVISAALFRRGRWKLKVV